MASKNEDPPTLDDEINYEAWLKDLKIWDLYTSTPVEKRGMRLYLTLQGTPRTIVRDLPIETISNANGLGQIVQALNKHFKKNDAQRAFIDLENFEKFNRTSNMSVNSYITQFEHLNCKLVEHEINYPKGVLAYKLIQQANLAESEKNIIKATLNNLDYEEVKQKMLTLFHDISNKLPGEEESKIKVEKTYYEEPVYMNYSNSRRGYNPRNRGGVRRGYNNSNDRNRNSGRGYYDTSKNMGWRGSSNYERTPVRGRGSYDYDRNKNKSTRKLNPVDSTGEVTKCAICNSIYHWAKDCPDAYENQGYKVKNTYQVEDESKGNENGTKSKFTMFCQNLNESITLFKTDEMSDEDELNTLLSETFSAAILDTGAPETVCGKKWMEEYLCTLTDKEKSQVDQSRSQKCYRFGGKDPVNALNHMKIPITIANNEVTLGVDVVDIDIPLLLSKRSLQRIDAKIDLGKNILQVFDQDIKLLESKTGHYILPISNHTESGNDQDILFNIENNEIKKSALKLHRHFSHPRKERLQKLLEDAEMWSKELSDALSEVEDKCRTCKIYSKPPSKPVVGFPYAKTFNDIIAIDLKDFHHNGRTYKLLHVIDICTRFSQAIRVKSKCKEEIVQALFKIWIRVFGPPRKILSDNGGEFVNKEFIEMCDKLNIVVKTTAAEAPWGNGVVERHHKVLCDTIQKTMEEIKIFEISLPWAVQAKNSLYNFHGFSPYILVFGRNPILPNVFNYTLPSLENVSPSEYLANNLNAMNVSRQAFVKSESEEKIKRALRRNVSKAVDRKYVTGDKVYIKRRDNDRWSGPGTVLGQDYQQILVRIGGLYYRVHPCRIMPIEETDQTQQTNMNDSESVIYNEDKENQNIKKYEENQDSRGLSIPHEERIENENIAINIESNPEINIEQHVPNMENRPQIEIEPETDNEDNMEAETNRNIKEKFKIPKRNLHIKFEIDGDIKYGTVMKTQPKQSGQYKDWVNIAEDNGNELCVNFEKVKNWQIIENDNEESEETYVCTNRENGEIMAAKKKEIQSWVKNNVFTSVKDNGQYKINVKWVINEKMKNGKPEVKARLVAKGYEDLIETRNDSPTCTKESIRLMLIIAAAKGWPCKSIDIRAAFLQGNPIDREVFLKPPVEFREEGKIWRLNRCVYGLNQASRLWYIRVKQEMVKLGACSPRVDPAYFVWRKEGEVIGILSSHVDDFLYTGETYYENNIISKLKQSFEISSESQDMFAYLGIRLSSDGKGYKIDQNEYLHKLKPIDMEKSRQLSKDSPVTENERKEMRSLVGKINWLVTQTRPDLAFETSVSASKINNAIVNDIVDLNKIVKKAKSEDVILRIPRLNDLTSAKIKVFADAALGNLSEGGSQGAYLIFIVDKFDNCALLSWSSTRVKRVARSILTGETLALCEAVDKAMVINSLISDILFDNRHKLKIECYTDSMSLCEAVKTSNTLREKRLLIDLASLRESIDCGEINIEWINTKANLANPLTKQNAHSRDLLDVIKNGSIQFC